MQLNVDFCRTMQERMFPIGTNLTQRNRALFREQNPRKRAAHLIKTGDVGLAGKENPIRKRALNSIANLKSCLILRRP